MLCSESLGSKYSISRPSKDAPNSDMSSPPSLPENSDSPSADDHSHTFLAREVNGQQGTVESTSKLRSSQNISAKYASKVRWFIIDQWFLVGLGILILIASQVQIPEEHQGKKETVVTYLCVSVIFIITGCTIPTKTLLENYRQWKIHLFVQVQSFLMTSALVFAVVSLCATDTAFMDAGLLIGLVFMGCVPTTISSNVVMTKQADGNQALTVVQSTLGNALGPFLTPLLVEMYLSSNAWYTDVLPEQGAGALGELYKRVFKQLGLSLFLPLVVGQALQNLFPNATKKVMTDWKLSKLGSVSLLIIIWQSYDGAFASGAFSSVKGNNMVFIVFISIAFYIIWTSICFYISRVWLDRRNTIAVAYCVPAKTPAMGVPLATVMFTGISSKLSSKIQIPTVIFQGFQIAAGSIMTIFFRRWLAEAAKKEEADEGAV